MMFGCRDWVMGFSWAVDRNCLVISMWLFYTSDVLYSMPMRRIAYSIEAAQYRSILHTTPWHLLSVKLCRILLSICSTYMSYQSNYHTCSCPSLHNIQITKIMLTPEKNSSKRKRKNSKYVASKQLVES